MLTILRVFLDYVACLLVVFFFLVSSFFVKLVFYCVAIDNYYLCFGTVPKVTKIFFLSHLGGRKWLRFMVAFYFSAAFKDRFLFIPHKQFCLL